MPSFRSLSALALMLAALCGCATPEYLAEHSHCEAEWMLKIPPVYRQEAVIKHRSEEQPSGALDCETKGETTICVPKMKTVSVPYTTVEMVDIHKPQRDPQIESCAARACAMKYGNSECKI